MCIIYVIQDQEGLVIVSLSQQVNQAFSVVKIEAMAATRALEFALEVGIDRVVAKGDSKMVVQALMWKNSSLASYGCQGCFCM